MKLRAEVFLYCRATRSVLFGYRYKHEGYELPGGKVTDGETLAQAAAREVLEETGIRCTHLSYLGYVEPEPGTVTHLFAEELSFTPPVVNGEPDEFAVWEWITNAKVNELTDATKLAIDKALDSGLLRAQIQ